jgi:hypothetical protein
MLGETAIYGKLLMTAPHVTACPPAEPTRAELAGDGRDGLDGWSFGGADELHAARRPRARTPATAG